MLNIESFNKEELLEVFKIGYLSNDANYVLSQVLKKEKGEIKPSDLKSLKEIMTLLENAEKGNQIIKSFNYYRGKDSSNISIFWQLTKLIYIFSKQPYEDIQKKINEIQRNLSELIDFLENKIDIPTGIRKEKILNIKEFLSLLSENYQRISHNR